jgi:hypothetical protein
MTFDLSRVSFDARRDFLGVIQAQGRVGLDADWNEWVAQLLRRLQVGTLDGLEGTAVPRITPRGFEIGQQGGTLTIGPGRMYVDGLLAENHGLPEKQGGKPGVWEPRLAELVGDDAVPYAAQPYQPYLKDENYVKTHLDPALLLPGSGTHLAYLDVWQRDITVLQDPRLIEPAIGEETTGRRQTLWQVKLLPNPTNALFSCASKDGDIPGWQELITAVPVRLTTRTADPPPVENPCEVAAEAGYGGLENQLYRVEVHNPGPLGTATLKWSRDNGSIAAAVTHIDGTGLLLSVSSLGRDAVLGFQQGGWVEVSDDWRVLAGQPGELRRIKAIHEPTLELELDRPLTAGLFAVDGKGATDPARHTLVRRWDNDPNDPDGGLLIAAAAGAATGEWLQLEHGIEVQISLDPPPKPGEIPSIPAGAHWLFAARRSTGALLDPLDKAPPLGTHHHYARLAVVTFPSGVTDCRRLWPPELAAAGGCDCTVCVTPEGHNSGTATLQMAIDRVKDTGGSVCLAAGQYWLDKPLQVLKGQSLRIRGQGWASQLLGRAPGPVLELAECNGITLEHLFLIGSATNSNLPTAMLLARDVADLRLEHCTVVGVEAGAGKSVGIGLNGSVLAGAIRECSVVAGQAVARVSLPPPPNLPFVPPPRISLFSAGLRLEQNVLLGRLHGVCFDGQSYHQGHTILRDNLLVASNQGDGVGVLASGGVLPDSVFRIEGNLIDSYGDGVQAGVDGLVISGNRITGQGPESGNAILLMEGLDLRGPRQVSVLRNRIQNFGRDAVRQTYRLGRLEVSDNQVEDMGEGALVMGEAAGAEHLLCRDNQFTRLGLRLVEGDEGFAAIQLLAVKQAELRGNQISEVAVKAKGILAIDAVRVLAVSDLQVAGNSFTGIGPPEGRATSICLRVVTPFERVVIEGNRMMQVQEGKVANDPPKWGGVLIGADLVSSIRYLSPAQVIQDPNQFLGLPAGAAILLSGKQILFVGRGARDLTLQGNHLEAVVSGIPLLQVQGIGHGRLAGNVLRRSEPADNLLADLIAESLSVSDNLFTTPRSDSATLKVTLPNERPAVVTGNTSTGKFDIVNKAFLPADITLTNLFQS